MRPRSRQRLVKALLTLLVGRADRDQRSDARVRGKNALHEYKINSQGYKERNGHWSILSVPEKMRVNAIHAALLRTGKVLIVAGSGNDRKQFDAGKFHTILWDPATDKFKRIDTPSDMFCAGHAPADGKLLIAGGTRRYEKLREDVTYAAGVMTVKNESPDGEPIKLPKGTEFLAPDGRAFRSTKEVVVKPAVKADRGERGDERQGRARPRSGWRRPRRAASRRSTGPPSSRSAARITTATTCTGSRPRSRAMQDYWGDDKSYLFDPATEKYERVDNMTLARWYPTLVGLKDGALSVSGLDEFGRIIKGDNEITTPRPSSGRTSRS